MSQYTIPFAVGAIILFAVLIFILKPLRALFKIIINSALGACLLLLYNMVGGSLGLYIGVNAYTALTVGILGIPGFLLIVILKQFL